MSNFIRLYMQKIRVVHCDLVTEFILNKSMSACRNFYQYIINTIIAIINAINVLIRSSCFCIFLADFKQSYDVKQCTSNNFNAKITLKEKLSLSAILQTAFKKFTDNFLGSGRPVRKIFQGAPQSILFSC